jgi:hypothetical protein
MTVAIADISPHLAQIFLMKSMSFSNHSRMMGWVLGVSIQMICEDIHWNPAETKMEMIMMEEMGCCCTSWFENIPNCTGEMEIR